MESTWPGSIYHSDTPTCFFGPVDGLLLLPLNYYDDDDDDDDDYMTFSFVFEDLRSDPRKSKIQ
ncbi:uncharacterized protein BO66DRAFT_393209 [Aspergillus aculeatinus CBS 121060]|uniref:Uncharacterized protein n=1 Tax=Aspergillus aculeatinus CBS 121060 TaxID=1448322 RepID=A0ACD1H3Q8_9EURO|nr:hypothetical protein BO66DRAFT_393209 [Aspergillus aculeatinus CBS 121060]RAH68198.1 hypothetical protein BO66DRAFT_393209 [Aspergillus aculeatinus CBS 121060]